jgi:hypothetical protein
MNRRQWILSGVSVAVLAGTTGCWLTHKPKSPPLSPPPTPQPSPPPPVAPAPSKDNKKPVEPEKPAEPAQKPTKPIKKTSIRDKIPQDPLAVETTGAAISRGRGLEWRKPKLRAVVTEDKWLAVRPLTEPGFGARAGAQLLVNDDVLRAHVGDRVLAQGKVVIAIRGARPPGAYNRFAPSHSLTITPPDHLNFCCTIGVWDPDTKLVSVYPASTVPNRTAIVSSALGVQNANMRQPGIADYVPGAHSGYKDYGFPFSIVGALRQNYSGGSGGAGALPVLRATSPSGMQGAREGTSTDDNVHCAETPLLEPYDRFSSEGCLVVAGRYTPSEGHTGPWAAFLKDAAFSGRTRVTLILVNSTQL